MELLVPFFIIFSAGLLFTQLSGRLHLPYVTALIVAGIILGDSGLGLVESTEGVDFFGFIGLLFLMFMAGSKVNLNSLKELREKVAIITLFCTTIPLFTGMAVGYAFSGSLLTGALIGILFISSSVAVVIPILDANGLLETQLGKLSLSTSVIQDIVSLFFLAVLLQRALGESILSIMLFLLLSVIVMVFLRDYIPRIQKLFQKIDTSTNTFESELRFTLVILFSSVLLFELIGLHAIVAAFVIGLLISESLKDRDVLEKIRTISYGIFVPIFFFNVGMQTDLSVLTSPGNIVLVVAVVTSLIISKQLSGWIGGRLAGLTNEQAHFVGLTSIPQLSTTLAVAFTALDLSLISAEMLTALVILTIVTSTLSPLVIKISSYNISKRSKVTQKGEEESLYHID